MSREVPRYVQQLTTTQSLGIVQPADTASTIGQLGDSFFRVAKKMQEDQQKNAKLKFEIGLNEGIEEISRKYSNNPQELQKNLDGWYKGFSKELPRNLQDEMKYRYQIQVAPKLTSAYKAEAGRVAEQRKLETLQSIRMHEDNIKDNLLLLNSDDEVLRQQAGQSLQLSMQTVTNNLMAKDSNGNFMFTPEQIEKGVTSLKDDVLSKSAIQWAMAQEDKLSAVTDVIQGKVNLELPDGKGGVEKINVRGALSSDAVDDLEKKAVGMIREGVALQNATRKLEETIAKEEASALYIDHSTRIMDNKNPITLEELEGTKSIYLAGGNEKQYLALREQLISGVPEIDDKEIRNELFNIAISGGDPTSLGLEAVKNGRIKIQTLNQALQMKNNIAGPTADILGFYQKQLQVSLAGINSQIAAEKGVAIADANIALTNEYNKFIKQKQRQPDMKEMQSIFAQIRDSYSTSEPSFAVQANKPIFIKSYELSNNTISAKEVRQQIINHYKQIYKDNQEKMMEDEDFIRDIQWYQSMKGYIDENYKGQNK